MTQGAAVGAGELVRRLAERGETLAVVESVTGGLVSATLVAVPGASAVFRGGLVVYATDLKQSLAGVPAELLAARGPVDPEVAQELALGGRRICGTDWAVATTGVAGPEPQAGVPVGTVHLAVAGGQRGGRCVPTQVRSVQLAGDRERVRHAAAEAALMLLASCL